MLRPQKILSEFSKLYPSAWKTLDTLRDDKGKDLPRLAHLVLHPHGSPLCCCGAAPRPKRLIGDSDELQVTVKKITK